MGKKPVRQYSIIDEVQDVLKILANIVPVEAEGIEKNLREFRESQRIDLPADAEEFAELYREYKKSKNPKDNKYRVCNKLDLFLTDQYNKILLPALAQAAEESPDKIADYLGKIFDEAGQKTRDNNNFWRVIAATNYGIPILLFVALLAVNIGSGSLDGARAFMVLASSNVTGAFVAKNTRDLVDKLAENPERHLPEEYLDYFNKQGRFEEMINGLRGVANSKQNAILNQVRRLFKQAGIDLDLILEKASEDLLLLADPNHTDVQDIQLELDEQRYADEQGKFKRKA